MLNMNFGDTRCHTYGVGYSAIRLIDATDNIGKLVLLNPNDIAVKSNTAAMATLLTPDLKTHSSQSVAESALALVKALPESGLSSDSKHLNILVLDIEDDFAISVMTSVINLMCTKVNVPLCMVVAVDTSTPEKYKDTMNKLRFLGAYARGISVCVVDKRSGRWEQTMSESISHLQKVNDYVLDKYREQAVKYQLTNDDIFGSLLQGIFNPFSPLQYTDAGNGVTPPKLLDITLQPAGDYNNLPRGSKVSVYLGADDVMPLAYLKDFSVIKYITPDDNKVVMRVSYQTPNFIGKPHTLLRQAEAF